MVLSFIYTKDGIQQAVKLETSLLAERRAEPGLTPAPSPQERGEPSGEIFSLLVMDEEYDELFKRLFSQAHAELLSRISANYLANTTTDYDATQAEFQDFREDVDFALWLNLHEDFPKQYRKSIDIKIEQFLIDYICYRWFETKSPKDAATFYARMEQMIDDVKGLLIRKGKPLRRLPSFP